MSGVVGTDDRYEITQSGAPWNFIGRWDAYVQNQVGPSFGTGILLGDKFVLTAGHVAYPMLAGSCFSPYYSVEGAPFGTVERNFAETTVAYVNEFKDIAIVSIEENTSLPVKDIPGMVLFLNPQQEAVGRTIYSAGYPHDIGNNEVMFGHAGTIATSTAEGYVTFANTMDIDYGQSGEPILYTFEGKSYTAGVVGGWDPQNGNLSYGNLFSTSLYSEFMGILNENEESIDPTELPENLILGSGGNDSFIGGHRRERIVGGDGNDNLAGGQGGDTIFGGDGNDTLSGNLASSTVDDLKADYLLGGAGNDTYYLGSSSDVSRALFTNDGVFGGAINYEAFKHIDVVSDEDGAGDARYRSNHDGWYFSLEGDYSLLSFGEGDTWYANQANGLSTVWVMGLSVDNVPVGFLYATFLNWQDDNDQSHSGLVFFEQPHVAQWRVVGAIEGFSNGDLGVNLNGGNPGAAAASAPPTPTLTGSGSADTLNGTTGDDVIFALGGNDTVSASDGNDSLFGHGGNDTLSGGTGNDVLNGGVGADVLNGGDGVDTASYDNSYLVGVVADLSNSSNNTNDASGDTYSLIENLIGSAFNDTLTGSAGNNKIEGGIGSDSLSGLDGNDILDGGVGADSLEGNDGNDTVIIDADDVAYSGGNGQDTLIFIGAQAFEFAMGASDFEVVKTNSGNDTVWGSNSADEIWLGTGNDTGQGFDGNDTIKGEDGDDLVMGFAGNDILEGGHGADSLYGGDGDDILIIDIDDLVWSGGDGHDTLIFIGSEVFELAIGSTDLEVVKTGSGNDTIWGSNSADEIWLGAGNDTGQGFDGNDIIKGEDGDDLVMGFAGDDVLEGGKGADSLYGGDDNDTVIIDIDDIVYSGGDGRDTLVFSGSEDFELSVAATDFEVIKTGSGKDTVWGSNNDDEIWLGDNDDFAQGFDGADTIKGQNGDDGLMGLNGNDVLDGGSGSDWLSGGSGNDTFVFAAGFGHDTIADFSAGAAVGDVIEFHDNVFANFTAVLGASAQVGSDVEITLDASNSILLQNVTLANLNANDFRFV